jgi:hypothetical protein
MDESLEDSKPVETEPQTLQPQAEQPPIQTEQLPTDAEQPPAKPRRGGRASLNRGPLTEKQECPDCNKVLSKHSLIYNTHKCTAKKKIVVQNIEATPTETAPELPIATAKTTAQKNHQPPPRNNFIDLDGDIDYDHQDVHNLVHGYFRHSKNKERVYKQEKFRSMLAGRL